MTESTSEYKKRIEEIKQSIENEPYMAKMREAIAEGISKTGIRQATVEEQFQSVLDETTGKDVISAPEIILARGGEANLKARLDKEHQQVTTQLAHKATKGEIVSSDLRNTTEEDRLGLSNLKEEVIQAMAGTTSVNSIPANESVTIEKLAPQLQAMYVLEGSVW